MFHFLFAGLLAAGIPQLAVDTPNRQPQLAASGNVVAMVFGSGKSIMFTKSDDRGRTFGKPVRIADMPVLALGRHRGPRVALMKNTIVVTAIGGGSLATGPHAHGLPSDGNLLAWRSSDGGRTWSAPVTVNDVPAAAREGLHSLAGDEQGNLAAVWLDLRAKGTRLYAATSADGGATWSPNVQLYESPDGTICECCHPSIVAAGRGEFAAMFRNAMSGNRDMYVVRMRAGQVIGNAVKMGKGSWPLNACPMDGGGIAVSKDQMISAWRRDREVFLTRPGRTEERLGEGKDVALAVVGDHPVVVWVSNGIQSYTGESAASLSSGGTFPAVVALADGSALVAWEENGAISLRTLR